MLEINLPIVAQDFLKVQRVELALGLCAFFCVGACWVPLALCARLSIDQKHL